MLDMGRIRIKVGGYSQALSLVSLKKTQSKSRRSQ